jgi:hypothetical protein
MLWIVSFVLGMAACAVGGDEDERCVPGGRVVAEQPAEIDSADSGQACFADDDVGLVGDGLCERFAAVLGLDGVP